MIFLSFISLSECVWYVCFFLLGESGRMCVCVCVCVSMRLHMFGCERKKRCQEECECVYVFPCWEVVRQEIGPFTSGFPKLNGFSILCFNNIIHGVYKWRFTRKRNTNRSCQLGLLSRRILFKHLERYFVACIFSNVHIPKLHAIAFSTQPLSRNNPAISTISSVSFLVFRFPIPKLNQILTHAHSHTYTHSYKCKAAHTHTHTHTHT